MRLRWNKPEEVQLDMLERGTPLDVAVPRAESPATPFGHPLMLPTGHLYADLENPRTESPEAELIELVEDIRQHGILQPIIVHPADAEGRYRIHFGAKRWRAAQRLELPDVPVVIRDAPADPYTQVAENQKRHGLTPLDLARLIRRRADAGDSNATIAKRMGIDQTTVAHHLALLSLPPVLESVMKEGRCTSPRTLYELSKLHVDQPDRVEALVAGDAAITRDAVAAIRDVSPPNDATGSAMRSTPARPDRTTWLLARIDGCCGRLDASLLRLSRAGFDGVPAEARAALRQRILELARRLDA